MHDVSAFLGQKPVADSTNKTVAPTSIDEVAYTGNKFRVPPFGHKVIHGRTGLILQGCKMHVMTHGLEKRSPKPPLGLDVLSSYLTLTTGSCKLTVVLCNNTNDWIDVAKGIPIAKMEAANQVPPVSVDIMVVSKPHREKVMCNKERQDALLKKLDLSGLNSWTPEMSAKARSLLVEYPTCNYL